MSENKSHFLKRIGQPPGGTGRNTRYDPDLHCQMVKDLARAGEFQEVWASEIGVTVATMRRWVREHDEFREAVIIAHQLLVTYWTRKVAASVTSEGAKPGMFQFLMRRFPAFYGREPIDMQAWLLEPDTTDPSADLTADQIRTAPTEVLEARVAELLRRRSEQ